LTPPEVLWPWFPVMIFKRTGNLHTFIFLNSFLLKIFVIFFYSDSYKEAKKIELKAAIDSNVDSSDTTSRNRSVKKRDRKKVNRTKDKKSDNDQPRPPSPILNSDEDGSSIKESNLINLLSNKINILFVFLKITIFKI
jgi:hypothetical protein